MERRRFTREFKVEAVKLVRERGVAVKQAARDLNLHENVLRKWVKDFAADPQQAFPGHGQIKPEQLEIERLRREVQKLKAERDILKKPRLRDLCSRRLADRARPSTVGGRGFLRRKSNLSNRPRKRPEGGRNRKVCRAAGRHSGRGAATPASAMTPKHRVPVYLT